MDDASGGTACCWILGAVLLIGGLIAVLTNLSQQNELKRAGDDYQALLRKLGASPNDSELRIRVLHAGRYYSALARKAAGSKGVTIFDEVALANDLAARPAQQKRDDDSSVHRPATSASGHYRVEGVDRSTKMDVSVRVSASSAANARAKVELDDVIVTSVEPE